MTAPEVFQVRDGDGWEVYVTNPAGGWRMVSSVGGTAVVDTLPDGAVRMVSSWWLAAVTKGGDRRG